MTHVNESIIADDNDFVAIAGPIKGRNPSTGELDTYHGSGVVAFIADDPASNTPLGTLNYASNEIGTSGKFPLAFDGADIKTTLTALADGDKVYAVLRAPGDIRRVMELTYRKTTPFDA